MNSGATEVPFFLKTPDGNECALRLSRLQSKPSPGFTTQHRQVGVKTFSWPLANGVTAAVSFAGVQGETVAAEYFEDLKDYLDLAKKKTQRES